MKQKAVMFYKEWADMLMAQPDDMRHALMDALLAYISLGTEPPVGSPVSMAFSLIKTQIDGDAEKYENICGKRSKAASKRWVDANACKCMQKDANDANAEKEEKEEKEEKAPSPSFPLSPTPPISNIPLYPQKEEKEGKDLALSYERDVNSAADDPESSSPDEDLFFPEIEENATGKSDVCNGVRAYFNRRVAETKSVMPPIRAMSGNRARFVLARCREHGVETIRHVIDTAVENDFLNGRNDRGWVATFDWLMKATNFEKTLEGNYDNRDDIARLATQKLYTNGRQTDSYDLRRAADAKWRNEAELLAREYYAKAFGGAAEE